MVLHSSVGTFGIIFFTIIGILAVAAMIYWIIEVYRNLVVPMFIKHKKILELWWWRFVTILCLAGFISFLVLLGHYNSWNDNNDQDMTEEEKELIEFESPRGLPTRYW